MSKRAEEAALKAWPITMVTVEDSYGNPIPYDGASVNRDIYREGYEQAEKDLELTWQDIKDIHIAIEFFLTHTAWDDVYYPTDEALYTEALKRYNEQKNQTHNDTEHT